MRHFRFQDNAIVGRALPTTDGVFSAMCGIRDSYGTISVCSWIARGKRDDPPADWKVVPPAFIAVVVPAMVARSFVLFLQRRW